MIVPGASQYAISGPVVDARQADSEPGPPSTTSRCSWPTAVSGPGPAITRSRPISPKCFPSPARRRSCPCRDARRRCRARARRRCRRCQLGPDVVVAALATDHVAAGSAVELLIGAVPVMCTPALRSSGRPHGEITVSTIAVASVLEMPLNAWRLPWWKHGHAMPVRVGLRTHTGQAERDRVSTRGGASVQQAFPRRSPPRSCSP